MVDYYLILEDNANFLEVFAKQATDAEKGLPTFDIKRSIFMDVITCDVFFTCSKEYCSKFFKHFA